MLNGKVSFVKACSDYFGSERKITIPEFKALTLKDKQELREELIREGYDVLAIGETA